jgi:hypothetical protein
MQNAVAEQRVQGDTLSGTTIISLRDTGPVGPEQGRREIEVIPEGAYNSGPISEADAVFCRDLLEFLGDFKSAAPKSSTRRRLGRAVASGTPVTRDSALHEDILFDFLRDYEAAPKMKPLFQARPAGGTPEPAGKSLGSVAVPPTVDQPEDTPFRVPPYVSAVSENTEAAEALLDVDAAWPEPQPSPAPVAKRLVAVTVEEPPAAPPVTQRAARAPVAKRQSSAPVPKRPTPLPVVKQQGPAPVAKDPGPEPVAQKPAPVAAPRPAPVAAASSPAPLAAAPSPAPVAAARRPDAKPAPAQVKKRPEPRPAPAPAVKPLGPAAARAKAIAEGLIV